MSPTRRDLIKAAGAIPAAIALGQEGTSIEPAVAAAAFDIGFVAIGATRDNVRYSLRKGGTMPTTLTSNIRYDGRTYTITNELSPGAQRILDRCLVELARLLAIEENEEGFA